jgi:hypothetical protein
MFSTYPRRNETNVQKPISVERKCGLSGEGEKCVVLHTSWPITPSCRNGKFSVNLL